ncbi:hypothetical protein BDM02DRAFT_3116265 [Thelephora ganbajun]|uniref:Uncharacterized protein n=1 Tax=Thelephora ganbajun TaxID=370292 RepID=A0ACB6ZEE9_THEGA|nr:hypothetical protein BDM02DRAFT_3116265 [Thelephora ganbajun]
MAYFDDTTDNTFYPASSTSGQFDLYPFLSQTSGTEETNTYNTFIEGWRENGQPGYTVGSLSSLNTQATFDSVSSVPWYATQNLEYDQLPYPGCYWPITGQYAQPHHSGIVNRDNLFMSTVAYWGDNENGPSTSAFYTNVPTPHQPSTDLSRTWLMPTRQFRPYGEPRARFDEHRNAEAGPSTLVPPPAPYLALATTNPSGGSSEATADAVSEQKTTEEDTAPKTRRPRGAGEPRGHRIRHDRDKRKLCIWAQWWKDLPRLPSYESALGIALEVIETIRIPIHAGPRLFKGNTKRTAKGKKGPDAECRRRKGARETNEELSRYYPLTTVEEEWRCPELLVQVLHDVLNLPKPSVQPAL